MRPKTTTAALTPSIRLRIPTATLVALCLSACGGGSDGKEQPQAQSVQQAATELDTLVPRLMERTGIPGVAIAVVYQGRPVMLKGFGVRKAGESAPVDADTVFQLASLSKSVGATAVARQVGQGTIGWDTPVQKHLPGFGLALPDGGAQVTVGDLYAHRSGLPEHVGDQLEDLGYARAEILQRLRHVPLAPYGRSYAYTNFGLTAAAESVARAAGSDWAALSEQTLYRPLGMARTSSRHADFVAHVNRAWGHVQIGGNYDSYGQSPARYQVLEQRQPDAQSPAGGVSSSAADMARWMVLVLGKGIYNGQRLIDETALNTATTRQSPDIPKVSYGYGFNVGTDPHGHRTISHSGAFLQGAHTAFYLWPDEGLGITVLTNAQPRGLAEAIAIGFGERAFGHAPSRDWLALLQGDMKSLYRPAGDLAGQASPEYPAPPQSLERYVGRYANAYYGTAAVLIDAAGQLQLVLGPDGGTRHSLRHWDGDRFAFEFNSLAHENPPIGSRASVLFTPGGMQLGYYSEDSTRGMFERQP